MKKTILAKQSRYNTRSVLEMTGTQARAFFLKPESYCSVDFPKYLRFGRVLSSVSKILRSNSLISMSKNPRHYEGVCYSILSNKDGRHAWRPFQLIHPAIYISLVEAITSKDNWELIKKRFAVFRNIPTIQCLSIPTLSLTKQKDKAAQILQWWNGIEQATIELALDFSHIFHADITDCYGSIYTHSIAWAMHEKNVAKLKRKDKSLIGNIIDNCIQDMRHGQTNGIPQGPVLMDFVAEIVLGYADLQLYKCLADSGVTDYRILRYRDDYRIFVKSTQNGEVILKNITEVMINLGLKLNTAKTSGALPIIANSIKHDKLAWLRGRRSDRDLQKHLLLIHAHSNEFTNAGSLMGALSDFHERVSKEKIIRDPMPLISIVVDIGYNSPRVFHICAAIVSILLRFLKTNSMRNDVIEKIHKKLSQLPNTGHMEIWLQRISEPYKVPLTFIEPLCELVRGKKVALWNSDWISSKKLRDSLNPKKIVDRKKLSTIKPVVRPVEIELFSY